MIILSRSRNAPDTENELAEKIAKQFDAKVLCIPALYDLRSFGPTVRRLRELDERSSFLAPFPVRASENLLKNLGIGTVPNEDAIPLMASVTDISILSFDDVCELVGEDIEYVGVRETIYPGGVVEYLDEPTVPRWYPVIDYEECIGCLECVNFCLFGVYVIGPGDKPLVDQPDACRNGCPACSRVCPGGAIMFPMHADPNISGQNDAHTVRKTLNSSQADTERSRHLDDLDDLVDLVDNLEI